MKSVAAVFFSAWFLFLTRMARRNSGDHGNNGYGHEQTFKGTSKETLVFNQGMQEGFSCDATWFPDFCS